jgi:TonB family protein
VPTGYLAGLPKKPTHFWRGCVRRLDQSSGFGVAPAVRAINIVAGCADRHGKTKSARGPLHKEPASDSAAIAKWHKALLARLARYNRYPAQANSAEGVVSLAFTVDRKGNIVTSRIEKTSGSNVLDAEALALLARAAPLPAPPPEVTDADLTFLLPVRFGAGEKH